VNRVRITGPAQQDIVNILRWSKAEFGAQAKSRYKRLIDRALNDLSRDPAKAGVRSIEDVRSGYFIYHLSHSKRRRDTTIVRRPRHVIVFLLDERSDVIVARLFDERQMLRRHLDSGGD
jgi:plasmid stabilization system protein ParE